MAYINKTTKTQARLENALLSLIKNKKFDSITVGDITELADVNRSTFYRHYLDKYDVLEKIEDEILNHIIEYHSNTIAKIQIKDINKNFQLNHYVNEHNNFFILFNGKLETIRILFSENSNGNFRKKLQNTMFNVFKKTFSLANVNITDIEKELVFKYQVGGFISILEFWSEHPELSSDNLFNFYNVAITDGIVNFVKNNMK